MLSDGTACDIFEDDWLLVVSGSTSDGDKFGFISCFVGKSSTGRGTVAF